MQSCFFKTSKVIDFELAKEKMIEAVRKTYGRKGEKVVQANEKAVLCANEIKEVNLNLLDENHIPKPKVSR